MCGCSLQGKESSCAFRIYFNILGFANAFQNRYRMMKRRLQYSFFKKNKNSMTKGKQKFSIPPLSHVLTFLLLFPGCNDKKARSEENIFKKYIKV